MKKNYLLISVMAFGIGVVANAGTFDTSFFKQKSNGQKENILAAKELVSRVGGFEESQPDSILRYDNDGRLDKKTIYTYSPNRELITEAIHVHGAKGWQAIAKREYVIKDSGKTTEITEYEWDFAGGAFLGKIRQECKFDDNNKIVEQIESKWFSADKSWRKDTRMIFGYDRNGNDTLFEYYVWNTEKNAWENASKIVLEFNNKGKKILEEGYYWDTPKSSWVLNTKYVKDYNAMGQEVLSETHSWNAIGALHSADKTVTYYNDNNRLMSKDGYMWDEQTNGWVLQTKYRITTYDGNGYPSEFEENIKLPETTDFSLRGKGRYTFDSKGNRTYAEYSSWSDPEAKWILTQKESMAFNSNNDITHQEYYVYDYELKQLIGERKVISGYHSNGLLNLHDDYVWDTQKKTWKGNSKDVYSFDAAKRVSVYERHYWDYDKWKYELGEKEVYFYPVPTSISPDQAVSSKVTFNGGLLVANTPVAEVVTVYSVSGKMVYRTNKPEGEFSVDLSALPKGLYIIKGNSGWIVKAMR